MPNEPQSWPAEADPDTLLGDLRRQLDAAKARMSAHREQMEAAGLARRDDRSADADPAA